MINPETGEHELSSEFTTTEQQSFAISQLELWNRCEVGPKYDKSKVLDANHAKQLTYQISSNAKATSVSHEATDENHSDRKASAQAALQSATKAAAELSMLVQLTTLLHSNKILSLQAFRNDDSHKQMDEKGSSPSDSLDLPVAQRIALQRKSMHKATERILAGVERCSDIVRRRREFTTTLAHCQSERYFHLCCVGAKSGKRIRRRRYDAKQDYLAIDCSVRIVSGKAVTEAPNAAHPSARSQIVPQKRGVASSAASVISVDSSIYSGYTAAGSFIPVMLGAKGVEISAEERARTAHTVEWRLLLQSRCGRAQGTTGNSSVVCGVTAWELLNAQASLAAITNGAVDALLTHCKRRKHETLCRAAFERLQRECVDTAARWDVLSISDRNESSATVGSEGVAGVSALKEALGTERLTRSVVVAQSSSDRILLRLSDSLLLEVSIVPIMDAPATISDAMEVVEQGSAAHGGVPARCRAVLARAMLGVFLRLLKGPDNKVEEDGTGLGDDTNEGGQSALGYWAAVALRQAKGSNSPGGTSGAGAGAGAVTPEVLLRLVDDLKGVGSK